MNNSNYYTYVGLSVHFTRNICALSFSPPQSKQPERSRYFGSPLEKVADEGGVPVFVRKCVEFVEREGLTSEGIYRVPGKKENVLLLQDRFEEDQTLDLASLNVYETAVSSTLKAYFKVLPDPLVPESVAAQLLVVNCELMYRYILRTQYTALS